MWNSERKLKKRNLSTPRWRKLHISPKKSGISIKRNCSKEKKAWCLFVKRREVNFVLEWGRTPKKFLFLVFFFLYERLFYWKEGNTKCEKRRQRWIFYHSKTFLNFKLVRQFRKSADFRVWTPSLSIDKWVFVEYVPQETFSEDGKYA